MISLNRMLWKRLIYQFLSEVTMKGKANYVNTKLYFCLTHDTIKHQAETTNRAVSQGRLKGVSVLEDVNQKANFAS